MGETISNESDLLLFLLLEISERMSGAMKKLFVVFMLLAWACAPNRSFAAPGDGNGTVNLTNYDSNNPIFLASTSTRLPVAGFFVRVLGAPPNSPLL